jgi:UDP-glucose 4-epimerase
VTRFLVTGGCGFIGRNLLRRLTQDPVDQIRVVDDLSVGTRQDLAAIGDFTELSRGGLDRDWQRLALVVGDICDADLACAASTGADVVIHLAANTGVSLSVADPRSDCVTNVIGTLNYLEACRRWQIRRFVFASSGAPVGEHEPPIHEEMPPHPVSPYGASKLAGEGYCSAYKGSFGIDTVALRFGNCYGPYSSHKSSVVAKFIREALAGEPWIIHGDGGQSRDFIFVDDIARAIISAATARDVGGEIFQIATNRETTIRELAEILARILAGRGIAVPSPRNDAVRIGDVRRNFSDTRKARDRLGWVAQVPLAQGLERTVDWFLGTRKPR